MEEMREILTGDGRPTGRVQPKRQPLAPGEYFPHVIVVPMAPDGRFVLQRRAEHLRWFAGRWDVTGGGIRHGERPEEAAAREVREELGVPLRAEDVRLFGTVTVTFPEGHGAVLFMTGAVLPVPPEGFRPDPREVAEVKLVPLDAFTDAIRTHQTPAFMEAVGRIARALTDGCPR